MTDNELIDYVLENRQHYISKELAFYFKTCCQFKEFTYYYRNKIRKKIREAKINEDLYDVLYELEIPYLILLDKRFKVEYEKYGTGEKRTPDFFITFEQNTEFNIEVKRIREASLNARYNKWHQELLDKIQSLPTNLFFEIYMNPYRNDPKYANEFLTRLETDKKGIFSYIKKTIEAEKDRIHANTLNTRHEYPMPGFGNELKLILYRPSRTCKPNQTIYGGGSQEVFYTNKELNKFGDSILEKLGQLMPNMINLLVLRSTSSTHEEDDLYDALMSLRQFLHKNDEEFFIKKGFKGKKDFRTQLKSLSGILLRSNRFSKTKDRNLLLGNDHADKQIPEVIKGYLMKMNRPESA